ncbi:MAG TPA: mechanosensitive ion channel domain-containing protein [Pyrinomonadaceae bacterium]|nr:mechanosensitive ion channel domain-containing protein [Pyrinomonadaceae bacterium]
MNELLNAIQEQWVFGLTLIIAFPVVIVLLNEVAFALARAGHPAAASVRFFRTWVVPPVALALFLRFVVLLPETSLGVRLAETWGWSTAIVGVIGLVNRLVFESAKPGTWRDNVPGLLRDVLRLLLVGIGLVIVYSFVWGQELGGAIAALGVTSIVVGLALQEPLGNLFSGLVLLMERPFEVGETIEVGNVSGEVKEVNWRSAHIEAFGGAIQVVPNSMLNKETILNFSRPRPNRMELIDVRFSYQDPPYKVREAMLVLLLDTDGVLKSPKPIVATVSYEDFGIKYRLIYRTAEADRWPVKNELVTRLWYMAKRHGFTMPYPVQVSLDHYQDRPFSPPQPDAADLLAQFPRLPEIAAEDRHRTQRLTFGAGERLFDEGDDLNGVYFVVSGAVSLQTIKNGKANEIATIEAGEFCGETGMHGHQSSDMRAVALEDTSVVVIAPDVVRHLFEASPRLARETGHTLEVHRKALQSARSALSQHQRVPSEAAR